MERIVEKVDNSDYKQQIHFLFVNNWSVMDVNHATLKVADKIVIKQKIRGDLPTGLIFDRTSHLKKD